MLGLSFNKVDQLAFYGSYHNNKWNQLIHVVFVPLIWWSACVWFCYTPNFIDLKSNPIHEAFELNGGFVLFAVYAGYYLTLDLFVGTGFNVILFALFLGANHLVQVNPQGAWWIAAIVHVLGWYMQIHPGHLIFEKRRPALFDSFFQSLVLAPLFVWYEVLFHLGLLADLRRQVEKAVAIRIKEMNAKAKATKSR